MVVVDDRLDPVGPTLVLVGPHPALAAAWEAAFEPFADRVKTHLGVFQDLLGTFDALLTPGNSYGQMDGGFDGVVSRHFAPVQRAVWDAIGERHRGFLPVGSADVVPTGDDRCPWLVYAPTMRTPMRLGGDRDVAIHDAMWAGLIAVSRHNERVAPEHRIATLACPGLGTGVGLVPPERAAQLMAAAYEMWRAGPDASILRREQLIERRSG
jgi:O-acetyl-ADP-ribose deacetylase (regulator of RNase III)